VRKVDNNDPKQSEEAKKAASKWVVHFKGMNTENISLGFLNNLEYGLGKDRFSLTPYDEFLSLSYTVRERLIERWIMTRQQYHKQNVKRIYYLSMEFLMGRLLANNIMNLGLHGPCEEAIRELGMDMEDILDQEFDADWVTAVLAGWRPVFWIPWQPSNCPPLATVSVMNSEFSIRK